MKYMDCTIGWEQGHVVVLAPDGTEWTEDTVSDAMASIREYWRDKPRSKAPELPSRYWEPGVDDAI